MSTYPYWVPGLYEPDAADVSYFPPDWFAQMAALASEKPFSITETGYVAEPFRLPGVVSMDGRELWQARYVDRLLRALQTIDEAGQPVAFAVWFVVRDYDRGVERLDDLSLDTDAFLIWRDTGLLDEAGRPRLGMEVWDRWLASEVTRP